MDTINDFLKGIGVTEETITALSQEEKPEDFDLQHYVASFREGQRDVYKNDPDIVNPIRNEIKGKELATIENKLKKLFELSNDEIKDLKFEDIVKLAKTKVQAKGSEVNNDLQTENVTLRGQLKEYEDKLIPELKAQSSKELNKYIRNHRINEKLSGYDLLVSPEAIFPAVRDKLLNTYDIVVDNGHLVVKTKDGLDPLDTSGTKVVNFDDVLLSQLNDLKVIKQSNGTNGTPEKVNSKQQFVSEGSEYKYNLPGLEKAKANIEATKNIRKFNHD